jgi:Coenzyme PQQ synthesis protein D (PqqD)
MMAVLSTDNSPPPSRVPKKADGFVSRSIADDTIIVPVRGGVGDLEAIFTLNAVGATIWNLIDGATPVERLAAAVAAEYEVTPDAAARDVGEFVQLLTHKGLLVFATEETGKA